MRKTRVAPAMDQLGVQFLKPEATRIAWQHEVPPTRTLRSPFKLIRPVTVSVVPLPQPPQEQQQLHQQPISRSELQHNKHQRPLSAIALPLVRRQQEHHCKDSAARVENSIKVSRIIFFIGLCSTLLVIFIATFDKLNKYRPHGTTSLVVSTYGIFIPLSVIVSNQKMRTFAIKFLGRLLLN